MPLTAKDRGKCWTLSPTSLTTHHAEGNSMASLTQMVVGKDISNPLTAEGLIPSPKSLTNSLTNSRPWNGKTT